MKRIATLLIVPSALIAGALLVSAQTRNPAVPGTVARREVAAAPTNDVASMAISPDGRRLVYSGLSEGRMRLWVKSLESDGARPLPGTDDAVFPFWSPDSQSIGFFANNALQRMDIDSGALRTLEANVNWGAGGTWNQDGTILYAMHGRYVIFKIPAAGGASQPVTVRGPRELSHVHPQFLPDGRHFLYYVTGPAATRGIYVGQLDTPGVLGALFNAFVGGATTTGSTAIRLVDSEAAGVYASGRLLFLRQGNLMSQVFDPVKLTLSGTAATFAPKLMLPADKDLKKLAGDELFARLMRAVTNALGSLPPGAADSLAVSFARMTPMTAMAQVVQLDFLPDIRAGRRPLDVMLYDAATKAGKQVGGLETVDEQAAVFDVLTLEEQVQAMASALDSLEKRDPGKATQVRQIVDLYLAGDLNSLVAELDRQDTESEAIRKKFMTSLLNDRNVKMADRIAAHLRENPARSYFFAVGAAHYAGDTGIIAQLTRKGLKVARLGPADAIQQRNSKN